MKFMNIDFHIHTKYSRDCGLSLNLLRKICLKNNIFPIITDHDTIRGALKYSKMFNDCIVGEEINTKQGEITGLFLNEEIKPHCDVLETISRIKRQGGLVLIPHVFDRLRKSRLSSYTLKYIKPDIIEIFNSRTLFIKDNILAYNYAKKHNYLMAVGSDAHSRFEVGKSFVIMDDFNSKTDFLKNLRKAKFVCKKSSIFVHLITKFKKLV